MAKNDLIFSRRADNGFLSSVEVANRAPAAFTHGHAEGLSSRYGEVSTARAIDILEGYGWRPTQAAQKQARKLAGVPYAGHMVAFANPYCTGGTNADERPEIVLYNSHDGGSSLRLFAGFYRFICSNGIVAGEGFEARLRHTSGSVAGFEQLLDDTVTRLPALFETITMLKARKFSEAEAKHLAVEAAKLRWQSLPDYDVLQSGTVRGAYITENTTYDLLMAKRYGDFGQEAFAVFNRLQEGLIRGGAIIQSFTDRTPYGKPRAAKAIGSVAENVRINRELWNRTLEVAELEPVAV